MTGFHLAKKALVVQSSEGELELLRISPTELTFRPLGETRLADAARLQVWLLPGAAPLVAQAGRVDDDGAVTATWEALPLATGRDVARFIDRLLERRLAFLPSLDPIERERIRAPARIHALLHTLFANRCGGRLQGLAGRPGWIRISAGRIEPESATPLQWESEELWPSPPFRITIDGYTSLVQFEVARAAEVDGFLAVPVPDELLRERSRAQRRTRVEGDVVLCFSHPSWPELRVRRPVLDVSIDGLRIGCSTVKDLIYPGMVLPQATVIWNDRIVCALAAEVRHVADDIDGEAQVAGLRLSFADEHDRLHYSEQVEALLYPNTRSDGTWSQQLWDLYRASGYLELSHKSEPEFVALKGSFTVASERLARSRLGSQVVWPSSRGLEASLSILQCYEHGSFIYQLARRQGRVPMRFPGRAILRDVYQHAVEDMQRATDVRWLIAWVQKSARFSRLVHVDMPQRYADSGRTLLWPFRALEADAGTAPAPLPAGLTVGQATPAERERFLAHVRATRAPHYVEAHDLSAETFEQPRVAARWAEVGFRRGRQLVAARFGAQPAAFALLEAADDGLHLFRLLDVMRFYPLEEGAEVTYPALLDEARRWYAARGKQRFVCFAEAADTEPLRGAGLRDLGEADAVLMPTSLLPELLEHVYEVTAPRDLPKLRGS